MKKTSASLLLIKGGDEYAFLKIRYKQPNGSKSKLISQPITEVTDNINNTSNDIRFAAAVAAFGQRLKGADYTGDFDYDDIIELATKARGGRCLRLSAGVYSVGSVGWGFIDKSVT